jgi:plasmid replication initiation protein
MVQLLRTEMVAVAIVVVAAASPTVLVTYKEAKKGTKISTVSFSAGKKAKRNQ